MPAPRARRLPRALRPLHFALTACSAFRAGVVSERGRRQAKVAVLEHTVRQGEDADDTVLLNLGVYEQYAKEASLQGAGLLVTPEYGITGYPGSERYEWGPFGEDIPEVVMEHRIIPCADTSDSYPFVLRNLSCMAKRHSLALVANLIDMKDCSWRAVAGCATSRDGWLLLNTDVVFDSDGAMLAKYHKSNKWGEDPVDAASECEAVTFTPRRMGVEFGLFTCADLIHTWPVRHLVQKGVRQFVMPLAWTNEMAQFQPLAWLQSWSRTMDVTLLAANARKEKEETGSGIFSRGDVIRMAYNLSGPLDELLVAPLPSSYSQAPPEDCPKPAHDPSPSILPLGAWQLVWLDMYPGRRLAEVCSEWRAGALAPVCCRLDYEATAAGQGYVLAALSGQDAAPGIRPWAAQVCAVLPCAAKRVPQDGDGPYVRSEFLSYYGEEEGAEQWESAEPADLPESCLQFPVDVMHGQGAAAFGSFASLELSGNFSGTATVFPMVLAGPSQLVAPEKLDERTAPGLHRVRFEGPEAQALTQLQLYGRLHLQDKESPNCTCGHEADAPHEAGTSYIGELHAGTTPDIEAESGDGAESELDSEDGYYLEVLSDDVDEGAESIGVAESRVMSESRGEAASDVESESSAEAGSDSDLSWSRRRSS